MPNPLRKRNDPDVATRLGIMTILMDEWHNAGLKLRRIYLE